VLREHLRGLIEAGKTAEALDQVMSLLKRTSHKLAALELKLLGARGARSEAVSSDQLALFMGLLQQTLGDAPTPAEGTPPAPPAAEPKDKKPKPAPHGRGKLPDHLPRHDIIVPVTGEDCVCVHCNREKDIIGYDDSEELELEPARLFVKRHRHEKRACKHCHADAVTAPATPRVIAGGLPGPALLTDVLNGKFDFNMPLERQSRRYGQMGHAIPPSTLGNWVAAGTALVEPLSRRFFELIMKAKVMQADGTGLKVLDRDHPDGVRVGAIWVYVAPELPLVHFRFINDKQKDGPVSLLKDRDGYVVVDADQKLNPLFAWPHSKAIESGCNMHGRRYFQKALVAGDLRATHAIKLYKEVYKVEREAREKQLDHDAIKALRQEKSKPLMQQLGEWARNGALVEDPKSALGKAFGYMVRQFIPLTRFLEDGRLPIDNGASERAIRNLAVGRRAWLFTGSDLGAERTAIAYSITGSCRLSNLNTTAYWQDALSKLAAGWPTSRLDELLPHNWAKAHPEHVRVQPKEPDLA